MGSEQWAVSSAWMFSAAARGCPALRAAALSMQAQQAPGCLPNLAQQSISRHRRPPHPHVVYPIENEI